MARLNWDKAKSFTGPTQEEIDRWNRLKSERAMLKPKPKKGMATKKQMRFIRRHNLIRDKSLTELSFGTATKLINKFIRKEKAKKKNGTTKNNNTGHRRDSGRTHTT